MKDIKYFLEEEKRFCQTEPGELEVWDENVQDWDYKRSPLEFLRQRPFLREYSNIAYIKEHTKGYDLTDVELTVLGLFIMHHSKYFRDDYYDGNIPEIAKNMFEVLDNVVSKAPVIRQEMLYRFCQVEDKHDMSIGDVLFVPYNLTCTAENWNRNEQNIYIIKTLPHDKTRAHDICEMYPHNINEHQVNFLRGTKFLVSNIERIPDTEFHRFYLEELEL